MEKENDVVLMLEQVSNTLSNHTKRDSKG